MPDRTFIERPDMSHIRPLRLRIDALKRMSDAQLLAVLNGEAGLEGVITGATAQLITAELHARALAKASKPHWSVAPGFVLLFVSTIAACIAAYPVVFPPAQVQTTVPVVAPPANTAQPVSDKSAKPPPPEQRSQLPNKQPQKK